MDTLFKTFKLSYQPRAASQFKLNCNNMLSKKSPLKYFCPIGLVKMKLHLTRVNTVSINPNWLVVYMGIAINGLSEDFCH